MYLQRETFSGREAIQFAPKNDVLAIDRPVDRENAVEVIDLMLEQLRQRSRCLHGMPAAIDVFVLHFDRMMTAHTDEEVRERETVVPELEGPAGVSDDAWIEQRTADLRVDVDRANRRPDLWSRDAASKPAAGPEVRKRFAQVSRQFLSVIPRRSWDRPAPDAKDRIAEQSYRSYGHGRAS